MDEPNSIAAQTKPQTKTLVDKTLGTTANLVKLLPGPTVLAFQTLSHSFTNNGNCHIANLYLTTSLICLCTLSCCLFTVIDTFAGPDGKVYYGIATLKGLYIFNSDDSEEEKIYLSSVNLRKYRIRVIDFLHAFFSTLVFLSLAFSDSDVQSCIFSRQRGVNVKELLVNLPLGVGFVSSLLFVIFPTSRKGIGYSDTADHEVPKSSRHEVPKSSRHEVPNS